MANEQELRLIAIHAEIANDIKTAITRDGDLSSLSTSNKTNLVAAINEVAANASVGSLIAANNLSDLLDLTVARTNLGVTSSADITTQIASALATITLVGLGGLTEAEVDARAQAVLAANIGTAPELLNTIQEIAAELENDNTAFASLSAVVSNKVDFENAQTLTVAQRLRACENIGVGNPDRDFLAAYIAVRDA